MGTIELTGSFRHEHLKKGKYTFILPLDPDVERLIGQIVVYWGAFELRMDALTLEVARGTREPLPADWKKLAFRKRKEDFKDRLVRYCRQMFPHMEAELGAIADRSGDLHWRRNIVAHGYYRMAPLSEDGSVPGHRTTAHGVVKGQEREIYIDVPTLNKLWHDISHLTGDLLTALNRMGGQVDGPDLVLVDEVLMQGEEGEEREVALVPVSKIFELRRWPYEK